MLEETSGYKGAFIVNGTGVRSVNGQSAGIQIAPPFRYDITACIKMGENRLIIEVATTLERQVGMVDLLEAHRGDNKPSSLSGIIGHVNVYIHASVSVR